MKKILFAAMIVLTATFSANAQTSFKPAEGTVTNTGSDTLELNQVGYAEVLGIQVVVTKTSGAVAGSSILYGSIDGVNFVPAGDTLTLSDQSVNTAVWVKSKPVYTKYRIITTGQGTMAAKVSAKAVARKP